MQVNTSLLIYVRRSSAHQPLYGRHLETHLEEVDLEEICLEDHPLIHMLDCSNG
jgi:hypothetical protein